MRLSLSLPLFLSASSDHNYNTALRIYGPPGMFSDDLRLPDLPAGAMRETNGETVERLGRDVTLIGDNQLSAVDSYRLYGYDERDRPFWGYGVEAARVVNSADVLILVRSDEEVGVDRALRWMPLSRLYTRGQALLFYEVLDTEGPTEEAMLEILKLFREVFEFAMDTNWSYRARLEFYHAFPFEELTSKEAEWRGEHTSD